MRAGLLDRRIQLMAMMTSVDQSGFVSETPSVVATIWAGRKTSSGREFLAASQIVEEERAVFTMRWRDDVTARHWIRFDGRDFDITAITEIGRRRGLEIHATARSA